MTISTTTNQIAYLGDGITVGFSFPYPFITTNDLKVYVSGIAVTTGFVVVGAQPFGGSGTFANGVVTFSVAPAASAAILIYCDPDQLQSTSLPPNDPFPSKTVEKMADKLTLLIQSIYRKFGNAITYPAGDTANGVLPDAATRANKVLTFDSSGNAVVVTPASGTVASVLTMLADTASAANAAGMVAYNAALSYAANTVGFKLKEVRSICDAPFNCRADGNTVTGAGTDWSTQVQAAITAAVAAGEPSLFIPPGVFKLGSQVTVPSQFTLHGAGNYVSIFLAPAAFNNAAGLIRCNGVGGPPTVIEDLAILGQNGGAGAVSCGLNLAANGAIARNLWVAAFKQNVILGQSDNFLVDCAVEEAIAGGTGITITSSDVTVSGGVIYHCNTGLAVSGAAYVDGTVNINNVRSIACQSIGFAINSSSNVNISNCSAGHNNTAAYGTAGISVSGSTNVSIDGFKAKLGGGPSAVGVGISVTSSSVDVSIDGPGQIAGFNYGIQVTGGGAVTINGQNCRSNGSRGIYCSGVDQLVINGNDCSNQVGTAGIDAGIYVDSSAGFAQTVISNNVVSGGGEYGIFTSLTDNGGSSGVTILSGNACQGNATSEIAVSGLTKNIITTGNNPAGAAGSAATTTITGAAYSLGAAEESIIANRAGTVTLTLPAPAVSIGRAINVRTVQAQTVVSATSNVVPRVGGAAGTAICAASAGAWAQLRSNGTAWEIQAGS